MNEALIQRIKQRYDIIGQHEALHRAIDVALKIAPVDLSVLITGENGVGKEVFPRMIHDQSLRKNKKYFAVNCGAIPEGTIDSELFGHEKGAFTGAVDKREGYFSVANGGTLFLDEVGELPLSTQSRLLRVLETGEYISVGASEVKKTDVRIVAATNIDMQKAIQEGKFREDLYYRLNSVHISIPPLRERGDDILLLFRKFAFEISEKYKMPPIRLTEEATKLLKSYRWPGNVRQLKNIAESLSVTAETREITSDCLSDYLPKEQPHDQLVVATPQSQSKTFENEREILYQILFDLRRDVAELKRALHDQKGYGTHGATPTTESTDLTLYAPSISASKQAAHPHSETFDDIEEVEGIEVTENFSLESHEKELIKRALQQAGGKRKEAATLLGISDRTLYRKINEYGLED